MCRPYTYTDDHHCVSMIYDPDKHHRRSIRLRGYDYSAQGAYFVTICVRGRECLLGDVIGGKMCLSEYGRAVTECWDAISDHSGHVDVDAFVVMPNHIHGIIVIVRATDTSPDTVAHRSRRPKGPPQGSLGAVVGAFKAAAIRRINVLRGAPGATFWQRNYYEHIIRDSAALARIRAYIESNPARWKDDQLHPAAPPNRFNQIP